MFRSCLKPPFLRRLRLDLLRKQKRKVLFCNSMNSVQFIRTNMIQHIFKALQYCLCGIQHRYLTYFIGAAVCGAGQIPAGAGGCQRSPARRLPSGGAAGQRGSCGQGHRPSQGTLRKHQRYRTWIWSDPHKCLGSEFFYSVPVMGTYLDSNLLCFLVFRVQLYR